MKKPAVSLSLFTLLVLTACAPSEAAIATAISLTQTSAPTETTIPPLPQTETPQPTVTETEEPTATFTPTPDGRVYDVDPHNLLLEREDLPQDARYFLPASDWISPHRNSEIISGMGVEEGKQYLADTQRVDGWVVDFYIGTQTVIAPEIVSDNVILYQTRDGARILFEEYNNCTDEELGFTVVESDFQIGDASISCILREMQPSGEYRVQYLIIFTYYNIAHNIWGWGWENDVQPEYIEAIAETLFDKIQEYPLSDQVTFSP